MKKFSPKQTFIQGTLILFAAGVVNRLLGFVPRITLPRIIGAEGVGLYQMGFPFLVVVLTFITGGIPLAVAKLVAEAETEGNVKRTRSILKLALAFSLTLGVLFMLLCWLAAPWITTYLLTDTRVYRTFVCMSPIIPIVAVSAVLRGYFQGRHNMIPTASSQIVETLIRIVAMLALSYSLLPYGVEYAAAGAMLGVIAGECGGMLVLIYHYRSHQPPVPVYTSAKIGTRFGERALGLIRRLLRISIPVTASKLVGSGSYFLESVMIVQSLAIAGIATGVATAQYGALQGMVIPILLLPSALTYSLAVSLVPSLSEAAARKNMLLIHKRLGQSLRLALVTGAPFAVIMFVLAEPLCYFLYKDSDVGLMLKLMAPVALFIYMQNPLQATLQALDRPGTALFNTFVGAAVKLVLIYQLATKPQWGIMGAVLAINANIVLVTILHWHSVTKLLQFRMNAGDYIKVGLTMLAMGGVCQFVMSEPWTGHMFVRFIAACLAGGFVYLIGIVGFRLIDHHDIGRLPWLRNKWNRP